MVQGKAGDSAEAEGKDRQIWSLAGSYRLDTVHRRYHRHRSGILQDTSWLDNASASGGKIRQISGMEPDIRAVLNNLQNSKNSNIFADGIELWCNGSTRDFGSLCPGSNPGNSTFTIEAGFLAGFNV